MASGLFKKKQNSLSTDLKDLSVSEAALSQSTFNIEKITDIQGRFRGGEVLLVPGRIFIRDGILWKVCRKGPKKRQFFLFNDVLVYGTIISRGHYGNQHIMVLSSMSVSSDCHYMPQVDLEGGDDKDNSPSELKPESAFQINHSDKSFHVYSHSKTDKSNWITNINKQITKITKNRDPSLHMYQKAVWVPDAASKQCMICKQKFSAFVRKHHCRMCGRVVCSACSPEKGDIAKLSGAGSSGKIERICKACKKPVILVTGGGVMGMERTNDDIIEIHSKPTAISNNNDGDNDNDIDDGDESSETEDSDDSEIEDIPVAPPRKKKHQPQPSKSPEPKKKNGPPPRPTYTPAKSNNNIKSIENAEKNEDDIIEETDSGLITSEQQPSPKTINDRVKSDAMQYTGRPKPPRPTRPGSGPPRPGSGPNKPGSDSPMSGTGPIRLSSGSTKPGSDSPMSDTGSEAKPVPKPRKTISKKDTERENDSGSDISFSVESPTQGHKTPENNDSDIIEEDTVDGIMEDNQQQQDMVELEQDLNDEDINNIEHLNSQDNLQDDPVEQDNDIVKEDHELIIEDSIDQKQDPLNEPVQQETQQETQQDDQENKEEEMKSLVSKRRRQKITKPIEEKAEDPTSNTNTNTTQQSSHFNTADLQPQEKSIRSPSTNARQRRSKFTTPQS